MENKLKNRLKNFERTKAIKDIVPSARTVKKDTTQTAISNIKYQLEEKHFLLEFSKKAIESVHSFRNIFIKKRS